MSDSPLDASLQRLEERLRLARDRAAALATPALERVGPYRIEEELGSGGMGIVFKARHESLDRVVALKLIRTEHRFSGEARERFLREARVVSRLDHKNLCRVYEFGEHEGLPWFAMQWIPGATLQDRLDAARRSKTQVASPTDLAALFAVLADALHYAHEAGLVHRDIKPSNIVLDVDPVILDFGVARDTEAADKTLTASDQMIGTPLYLPPERVRLDGSRDDRRQDVYALGVTLYECLTLERPFDGPSSAAIFESILRARPKPIRRLNPAVDPALETVVRTAMDPDKERRYETARAFADDLRRAARGETTEAKLPGMLLRTRRWIGANPVAASVLGVLGVSTIAIASQWLRAERNLRRFDLLATDVHLQELREDPAVLLPARSENVTALEHWLASGALPLLDKRPDLEAARDELRKAAFPYDETQTQFDAAKHPRLLASRSERKRLEQVEGFLERLAGEAPTDDIQRRRARAERERARIRAGLALLERDPLALRSHRFSDPSDQYLHDGLERLLAALHEFEHADVERVRDQLAWAKRVQRITIDDVRRDWDLARDRVAKDTRFEGLELTPQLGLVPIGPDPSSRLEEFAFVRSGSLPRRAANGVLHCEPDCAIVFVLLPPSVAHVGRNAPGEIGDADELPVHDVRLDAFFFAKHELTQAQWISLTRGEEPSKFLAGTIHGERVLTLRNPVEQISYDRTLEVLSMHELTIPTEVQWEYACRAPDRGALTTSTPWWTGADLASLKGAENLGDATAGRFNKAWHKVPFEDGHYVHAPVGTFRANAFGLHDMHGNVREWCLDRFHPYSDRARNGDGLRLGSRQSDVVVTRGGAFDYDAIASRSARRDAWPAYSVSANQGARAARAVHGLRNR
ncbi:MAG: SUMF1/EgtB/PvdO family nonheme iron enzyme [Planctomycetes bacterium]|nr:SUMF1/EgtB/PvdO family nonheme iron enzyme [Planctomycetota bacterium]MCB9918005.1 SUMF1/EgtB/PvdO family nonheme iron enzyme [Planctomycetota bacterium]